MTEHLTDDELHALLDREEFGTQGRIHLQSCETCSRRLHKLQQLFGTLAALPDEPLGKDLAPAVVASIAQAQRARRRLGLMVALEAGLAALVAVLVVPLLWEQYGPALQALRVMPEAIEIATVIRQNWQSVASSISGATQGFSLELLEAIAGYPWVWLISAAALLWLGGNGLMLRLLNRAE